MVFPYHGWFWYQYPLVNVYITMERSTILWENSLSMAIFHSFFYVYQAGSLGEKFPGFHHWFKQRQAALSWCQLGWKWHHVRWTCPSASPHVPRQAGKAIPDIWRSMYIYIYMVCIYIYMEVTIYKLGNKPEDMFIDIFYYPSIPDIWINYIMLVRGNYPKIALLYLIIHISGQWIIVIYPEILGRSSHLGSSSCHPSYKWIKPSYPTQKTRDTTYFVGWSTKYIWINYNNWTDLEYEYIIRYNKASLG